MMKVSVMNGIGKMGYTERPIPVPRENEVYWAMSRAESL